MLFFFKDFPKIKSLKNQKKNILVSLKVPYIQGFFIKYVQYFIKLFLIITIIVMLILAGVSLNAIVRR